MAFVECPAVEVFPDCGTKAVEDRVKRVRVGRVEDADNSFAVVLELVACNTPPVVSILHGMGLVRLDAGGPCVQEGAVGGRHPALSRE